MFTACTLLASCQGDGWIASPFRSLELEVTASGVEPLQSVRVGQEARLKLLARQRDGQKKFVEASFRLQDTAAGNLTGNRFVPGKAGRFAIMAEVGPLREAFEILVEDNARPVPGPSPNSLRVPSPVQPTVLPKPIPDPLPATSGNLPVTPRSGSLRLSIIPSRINLSRKGEQAQFSVFIRDEQGNFLEPSRFPLIWSSNRPEQISINAGGKVTAEQPAGFVTITAALASDLTVAAFAEAFIATSGDTLPPSSSQSGDDEVEGSVRF